MMFPEMFMDFPLPILHFCFLNKIPIDFSHGLARLLLFLHLFIIAILWCPTPSVSTSSRMDILPTLWPQKPPMNQPKISPKYHHQWNHHLSTIEFSCGFPPNEKHGVSQRTKKWLPWSFFTSSLSSPQCCESSPPTDK